MAWFAHIIHHQTSKGVKGYSRLCGLDVVLISEGLHLPRYLRRISLVSSSCTLFEFLHQEGLDVISPSGGSFWYLKSPPQWSRVISSDSAGTILTLLWGLRHIRSEHHPCNNSCPFPPSPAIHRLAINLKTVLESWTWGRIQSLGKSRARTGAWRSHPRFPCVKLDQMALSCTLSSVSPCGVTPRPL